MPNYNDWYTTVRQLTEHLVAMRSVSPGEGEIQIAHEVLHLLRERDIRYTDSGLEAIEHDPHGRQVAYAFLQGKSPQTLVLLGHIDTVDTKDYGSFEPLALSVDAITEKYEQLGTVLEGTDPNDWMFGRGTIDMKCGVAAIIALMRYYATLARNGQLPISLVMLATPDEENESAGVLQGVRTLLRLREQYGLKYVGAINTDYTTALYPGDAHRYVYSGTVGKLLPSFLCIGQASHVGAPFNGLDANLLAAELIRRLSMNEELCDVAQEQITAPPVTLHFTDLKDHYDVQLPFAAYFYLNVLTFTTTPDELLERLRAYAHTAMTELLARLDATEKLWRAVSGEGLAQSARSGVVLTYAELYEETVRKLGCEQVDTALMEEWERWPASLDKRERSLYITQKLWTMSGRSGPAILIYYAPPYYPHVTATQGALQQAIDSVVANHSELSLVHKEYYPYLSDISYLCLDSGTDVSALTANMSVWREPAEAMNVAGSYTLPLDKIAKLDIPVFNFGPYGQGAHQRDEAALMSYSFGVLPQLLCEVIEKL